MPDTWEQAWSHALDELEVAVGDAEAILAAAHTQPLAPAAPVRVWAPPAGIGPIPDALRERAGRVLEQQRHVTARLDVAVRAARQGSRVLDKIAATSHMATGPLFVDVDG